MKIFDAPRRVYNLSTTGHTLTGWLAAEHGRDGWTDGGSLPFVPINIFVFDKLLLIFFFAGSSTRTAADISPSVHCDGMNVC